MADEELGAQEGVETVDAPVEGAEVVEKTEGATEAQEEQQAPDPIAALATELGWAPKDQFRGNPEDWKPADEFIRAGRDIQRTLSRDLRDVRSTMDNIVKTNAMIMQDRLKAQREELEARFTDAVDSGDTAAARKIGAQLTQLEHAPVDVPTPPTPEGQNFAQKHSTWFGKDQEATKYAVTRAEHYAKQGLSAARQLAAVEQDMRGIFPDLFPAPAKAPPEVHRPQSRSAAPSNKAKGFHDLPREAQAVARDMVERGVIPNVDGYVRNFFAQAERKVG